MPPQTPQTSTAGSLDLQAVALAKAIRQTESGGDAKAKGKSGEYGAYQYTHGTWAKDSVDAGVNVPLEQSSIEDQNKVAYHTIKKWKDAGYNPGQIASMWNAGGGEPDAYTGKFSNGKPSTGVNSYGVHYDVPAYAKSVATAYQTLKQGGQVQADPQNPSSTANETSAEKPKVNFLTSLAKGIVEPVATMVARPLQAGAELLGASEEDVNKATKNIAGDWVAPVPHNFGDVTKDVGRAAQTVALGMPAKGILGAAAMGATSGAGAGLEQTGTLEGAAKGGLFGAGAGAIGGGIAKVLEAIPNRLAQDAFKNMSPEEVQKALQEKSIGSPASLLRQSQKAVANYGNQIDDILTKSQSTGGGDFAVRATTNQFPEFVGKESKMIQKIKSLVPAGYDVGLAGKGWDRATILSYIDKIANGTASLWEKNRVRSVIDGATAGGYAKLARSLNPSAGHDLAMTFAGALRSEVQKSAPETVPIFEEFAKEMGIKKAIEKIASKKAGGLIQWRDIVPYLAGSAIGGLPAGLLGIAANRVAQSPATEFAVAKGMQGLNKAVTPVVSRAGLLPSALKQQSQ